MLLEAICCIPPPDWKSHQFLRARKPFFDISVFQVFYNFTRHHLFTTPPTSPVLSEAQKKELQFFFYKIGFIFFYWLSQKIQPAYLNFSTKILITFLKIFILVFHLYHYFKLHICVCVWICILVTLQPFIMLIDPESP